MKVVGSPLKLCSIMVSLRGARIERAQSPQMASTATATVQKAVNPSMMCVTTTEAPLARDPGLIAGSIPLSPIYRGLRCDLLLYPGAISLTR